MKGIEKEEVGKKMGKGRRWGRKRWGRIGEGGGGRGR